MLEMERSLRQVNIDYQQVGFYQSTYLNTHCDRNFLDSVFDYLEEMNEAIALIYGLFYNAIALIYGLFCKAYLFALFLWLWKDLHFLQTNVNQVILTEFSK